MSSERSKQEWLRVSLLGGAVLLAIGIFHERLMASHDPVNFVLALKYGYSIAEQRPHPPGYPAFFLLWKLIERAIHWPPHTVILVLNGFFAISAVILTWIGAKRLYDERIAWWSAVWVATNPLFLYYSCTAEIYAYDAAFSAFLVILLLVPPKRFTLLLYVMFGMMGSFRLSSLILIAPVLAVVMGLELYHDAASWKKILLNCLAIVIGSAVWVVPFVVYLGSWSNFRHVLRDAAYLPTNLAQNLSTVIPYVIWFLNIGLVLLIIRWRKLWNGAKSLNRFEFILLLLVAVPSLFFGLKTYAKGYALLMIAPAAIMLVKFLLPQPSGNRFVWCAVIGNLMVFFLVPFVAPSVESIKTSEHRTIAGRVESAVLRGTSYFAPTLSHLRRSDQDIENIKRILDRIPDSSYVVLDNSATRWAYPRSVQFLYPALRFLVLGGSGNVRVYAGALDGKPFDWKTISDSEQLYYLTTTDFEFKLVGLPAEHWLTNGEFSLYHVIPADRERFAQYVGSFFKSEGDE